MKVEAPPILVAEDDRQHAILVRAAFDSANFANPLRIVGDGQEAIDYLSGEGEFGDRASHPLPALVLLDLQMPRKSGLDVLEWLGGRPELKHIPAVLLTSSRDDDDIRRAYELGATSYLLKPVGFEALIEVIRTLGLYWLVLNQTPERRD